MFTSIDKRHAIWSSNGFFVYLHNFDIRQTFQEGFQINAIQHNTIVKNVSIWLEVNYRLFLNGKRFIHITNFETRLTNILIKVRKSCLEMREHVGVISNEESVRHVSQFLRVLLSDLNRRRLLITDDVVHERSSAGTRVAEPHSLRKIHTDYMFKFWYILNNKFLYDRGLRFPCDHIGGVRFDL